MVDDGPHRVVVHVDHQRRPTGQQGLGHGSLRDHVLPASESRSIRSPDARRAGSARPSGRAPRASADRCDLRRVGLPRRRTSPRKRPAGRRRRASRRPAPGSPSPTPRPTLRSHRARGSCSLATAIEQIGMHEAVPGLQLTAGPLEDRGAVLPVPRLRLTLLLLRSALGHPVPLGTLPVAGVSVSGTRGGIRIQVAEGQPERVENLLDLAPAEAVQDDGPVVTETHGQARAPVVVGGHGAADREPGAGHAWVVELLVHEGVEEVLRCRTVGVHHLLPWVRSVGCIGGGPSWGPPLVTRGRLTAAGAGPGHGR